MQKVKLVFTMMTLCIAIGVLTFGVYALSTVNYAIGGSIVYTAPSVLATVAQAQITGATISNSKMQAVVYDAQNQSPSTTSWSDIDLTFNETRDDIVISFRVTNNSSTKKLKVDVDVLVEDGNLTNATVTPSSTQEIVNESGYVDITITAQAKDKSSEASITGMDIELDLLNLQEHDITINYSSSGNVSSYVYYKTDKTADWIQLTTSTTLYDVKYVEFSYTKPTHESASIVVNSENFDFNKKYCPSADTTIRVTVSGLGGN